MPRSVLPMVLLLPLILLQDPQEVAKPPVVRTFAAKRKLTYSVNLTSIGERIARHEYELELAMLHKPEPGKAWPAQFSLRKLTSDYGEGNILTRSLFGLIDVAMPDSGFPEGLSFEGEALPFALPLLAFWLPEEPIPTDKPLAVRSPVYNGSLTVYGTATAPVRKDERFWPIRSELYFQIEGEMPDLSKLRKLVSTCDIDARDGMPHKAEGKYVARDGTVKYTIRRK